MINFLKGESTQAPLVYHESKVHTISQVCLNCEQQGHSNQLYPQYKQQRYLPHKVRSNSNTRPPYAMYKLCKIHYIPGQC